MSAKHYRVDKTINFSWEQAVSGFWLRYPNPYSRHVLTEDVVDRFIDADGRLHTRRLFMKTSTLPKWISAVIPTTPKKMWIVEDSICDYENKIHNARVVNIGHTNIAIFAEFQKLTSSTPTSTLWHRHAAAWSFVYGVAYAMKVFAIERYKHNSETQLKGLIMVLSQLYGNASSINETSEWSKRMRQLEKLRQSWKGKGEKLAKAGLGAAGLLD